MELINILAWLAISALVNAQFTTSDNGTITCAQANATYCTGPDSNIIIRCTGTVGQAGNCNDNLAGEPPLGVNYSPCFECSPTSGRAACSKDGIVYPGSGSGLGVTPFHVNQSAAVCNATTGGGGGMPYPYPNSTASAAPTGTVYYTAHPHPYSPPSSSETPVSNGSAPTYPPVVPQQGAASSRQLLSAGGIVALGAVLVALA